MIVIKKIIADIELEYYSYLYFLCVYNHNQEFLNNIKQIAINSCNRFFALDESNGRFFKHKTDFL